MNRPFHDHADCGTEVEPGCLDVSEGSLFAEVYNCDFEKPPKPEWADRAKKQLYRSNYVLAHYVHYSTVTAGLVRTKDEANEINEAWHRHFRESRKNDNFVDEIHQAVMLHTKTVGEYFYCHCVPRGSVMCSLLLSLVPEYTKEWKIRCKAGWKRHGQNCRVGFPWPQNNEKNSAKATSDGYGYNCFTNEKLSDFWVPKLRSAMHNRSKLIAL